VLIDFGWAISDTKAYLTPKDLNCFARPPDDSFCDVYSMGKVFEQVNQHQHSVFDPVIKLMTNSNPSLRTTELETLKLLFSSAIDRWLAVNSGSNINDMSDEQSFNNHRMRRVIGQLVEQISKRDQRISWLEIEHERLVQRLAETEWRAQSLSAQVNTLAQEMTIMYTLKWWKAKLCGAIFEGLLVFGRKTLPLRVRCWLHARLVKILRMVS
jgi:hypothetical protein